MVPFLFGLRCIRRIPVLAVLAAASIVSVAQAQGVPQAGPRVDPLDAQARVPAVTYASPLAGYRRLGDDKRVPWKEANETVNRIGGWRAYAREAQLPDAAASVPSTRTTPAPGPAPVRDGHHKH